MKKIAITKNDNQRRVDAFLKKLMPQAPLGLIYKYIRTNKIKVNGKRPKPDQRLGVGDELVFYGDESLLIAPLFKPEKYSLDIVYEDKNILIINKPSGLACQPDIKRKSSTLVDFVKSYLYEKGEYTPQTENTFAPALCNRIDVNTAGMVIAAKNIAALRSINSLLQDRMIRRFYLCETIGAPTEDKGIIRSDLIKDKGTNKTRTTTFGGKYAETRYKVLKRGKTAIIELEIITGRSHQIRVHLNSIGYPILGDPKYGKGGSGQRLVSYRLLFKEGISGEMSYLSGREFQIPVDMNNLED